MPKIRWVSDRAILRFLRARAQAEARAKARAEWWARLWRRLWKVTNAYA